MCEQCQSFDDDEDDLAAAFVARQSKLARTSREAHALLNRKAAPKPALPAKREG